MSIEEMKIEDKAEFMIAVRNYKCEKKEKWADGMDYTASDKLSKKKVMLRFIEPQGKSGFVNVGDVKSMVKVMKRKGTDFGILIGKRFSDAATQEMAQNNIEHVSDVYMPPVKPENIILTINGCIDNLCLAKCGAIPLKESDCKARIDENSCKVRSISDDALFHFKQGWLSLMKSDLRQLLSLNKHA
jgi:hypothetical protein